MALEFRRGRPTDLTSITQSLIIEAVNKFLTHDLIAGYAYIHPDTLKNWLQRGESDHLNSVDSEFEQFFVAYSRARADNAALLTNDVRKPDKLWLAQKELMMTVYRDDFYKSKLLEEIDEKINKVVEKMETRNNG